MPSKPIATVSHRIRRVCDYIQEHLDQNLSLNKLSELAICSKYHFHRQFRAETGITTSQFISRLRLKRASYQLVFHLELSVGDIALQASYENPESFSRAFKRAFQQSPTEFRKEPLWEPWHEKFQFPMKGVTKIMDVEIVTLEEQLIAVKEHHGNPARLNDSIAIFIDWRKTFGLSPINEKATYGVAYHDPKNVSAEEFRFDICGVVDALIPDNPQGVVNKVLPSGRCAKLTHHGSRDQMDEKVYYLYENWMPDAKEEPRDFPVFFRYCNLFPEVPESELETEIYVPLA